MQIDFPLSLFYYDSHEHNCCLEHFDPCSGEVQPFSFSEPPMKENVLMQDPHDRQKDSSESYPQSTESQKSLPQDKPVKSPKRSRPPTRSFLQNCQKHHYTLSLSSPNSLPSIRQQLSSPLEGPQKAKEDQAQAKVRQDPSGFDAQVSRSKRRSRKRGEAKDKRKPLQELKNFLQDFKRHHLSYLQQFGKINLSDPKQKLIAKLRKKKNAINRKDYLKLYKRFKRIFRQMFKDKYLESKVERCNSELQGVYRDHLFVFENAFTTGKFPRINHIRAKGQAFPKANIPTPTL